MSYLKLLCLKSTLISLCLIFTSFNVVFYDSNPHPISIEQAVRNNLVNCNISSNGGHEGSCINMNLENKSLHDLTVKIESGRNLLSNDTNKQDILIVNEEIFVLKKGVQKGKDLFGFCSQSNKGSPSLNETYSVGDMKDKKTVQLTNYLSKNNYPLSAMQNAIWVMTNNRRVEGIFHENRDSIQSLMDYVSDLTYQFTPWYSIQYFNDDSNLVSDNAKQIWGEFEGRLLKDTKVKVVVFDMLNIAQLRKEIIINEEANTHPISVDVSSLPKGRYHIGFYVVGGGRVDEKVFSI
ncbi:hypothetical protein FRY74_00020 [Vicingus serpentipes]|uniref:Uncharacterized protein n=1 Tax=Vicingus serpentipes TaxID=1926625 RepID=A0A5C6RWZ2_9FLAO|nr:hypothetical protein [Vicingus serpentipes]TXB66607.1 hypothetical protein FRY74_00020 [Vicingus serpentipes]